MDFKKDVVYLLTVQFPNRNTGKIDVLTFECTVEKETDNFIEIKDKYGNTNGFNKNSIIKFVDKKKKEEEEQDKKEGDENE